MSFLRDFEKKTVEENAEYFVLVRCGVFYIALSREAIFLSKCLDLKICYMGKVAKIAFPVNVVWKYISILKQIGYSFIIYDYVGYGEVLIDVIGKKRYVVKYEYIGNKIPIKKTYFSRWLYE